MANTVETLRSIPAGTREVRTPTPFPKLLKSKTVVEESRRYEPAFMRWERVRHGAADQVVGRVVINGQPVGYTGFEGYFVGAGWKPNSSEAEVLEAVEKQEQAWGILSSREADIERREAELREMIRNLSLTPEAWVISVEARLGKKTLANLMEDRYRDDPMARKRLLAVIGGESFLPEEAAALNGSFKAIIARGKAMQISNGTEPNNFYAETFRKTASLPEIEYLADGFQSYFVEAANHHQVRETRVELSPDLERGYRLMENIGIIIGHPLTRASLHS